MLDVKKTEERSLATYISKREGMALRVQASSFGLKLISPEMENDEDEESVCLSA